MKVVTLTETLPALTEIAKRLDKLSKIEAIVQTKSTVAAAAIRDCRAGIKSALAGMLNQMKEYENNESIHTE